MFITEMITWLQYNGNIMVQLQWITIILKCFEVLKYAVHFIYFMLCCSVYLGKTEIYIIHIILLLLCIADITLMSRRLGHWSASLFSWVLPGNRNKKWSLSKEHYVQYTKRQTYGTAQGNNETALVRLNVCMVPIHQQSSPCHIVL